MAGLELREKKRIAFVCSGGAVKAAAFHCGVALALEHVGFKFAGGTYTANVDRGEPDPQKTVQIYVGSSAGSLIAAFLANGGALREIVQSFRSEESIQGVPGLKYVEMFNTRVKNPADFLNIGKNLFGFFKEASIKSPFNTEGIVSYIKTHVLRTENFSELEPALFIVATDVNQSKKYVFGKYKSAPLEASVEYRNDVAISDACGASMSLPPIYHPYSLMLDGEKKDLYDGEIREPLNDHVALEAGADLIICSYTHQPLRMLPGMGSIADRGVQQLVLQAVYQAIEQKIQASRASRKRERSLVDSVSKFFKENGLGDKLADELIGKMERRMNYKRDVDYIYIHPRPSDLENFYLPHFSLKRKHTEHIVKRGFIAGVSALKGLAT